MQNIQKGAKNRVFGLYSSRLNDIIPILRSLGVNKLGKSKENKESFSQSKTKAILIFYFSFLLINAKLK
jgi:hypothetical protein